jgi:hypothetical protein
MSRIERSRTNRRNGSIWTVLAGIWLTTILLLGFPLQAAANAPKEVLLSYDAAAHTLTVQISHSSSSPGFHYIANVEIKKGGKTISTTDYKSQPDQATFSYVYPIEVTQGDILEVKASCSIFGSKTEKLTVNK